MLERMHHAGWHGIFVTFNYDKLLSHATKLTQITIGNSAVTQLRRNGNRPSTQS